VDIKQKLEIIQQRLGLTQTALAHKLGVSFVALHNWRTGKAQPRARKQAAIDELYLEVTGQKIIPTEQLAAKKQSLQRKASVHRDIVAEILDNPDIRDQLILTLTYNSNSIEGNTLTEPDTAAVLFDNVALPHKTLTEQLEAKNHQAALSYLFSHLREGHVIDEALILRLHAILMNGIRPDAGAYRSHAVRIPGVHLPTANYVKIPELMPAVVALAAQHTSDVMAACALVHSRFEQIHPFSDGNGRIGRLLMNAMLLQAQHAPAILRQDRKRLYYTFLYKAQTAGDHSQLEDFLCDAVAEGFAIVERRW